MKSHSRTLTSHKIGAITLALLMASFAPALLMAAPNAYAATDLSSWCSGTNLSYSASFSGGTCTVSGSVTMSTAVTISDGELLYISGSGSLTIYTGVTLTVDGGGRITVENSGVYSSGITNGGTLSNSGTITVDNSGESSNGIANTGTLDNSGTIDNPATIVVENSNGIGINNFGTLDNSGTIMVVNTGSNISSYSDGIDNTGTIDNYGTIDSNPLHGNGIFSYGGFNEECGATVIGTVPSRTLLCGPVYLSMETALSSIQSSFSGLSSAVTNDFSSLSSSISTGFATLQTDLKGNFTSIQTSLGGISTSVGDLQSSVDGVGSSLSSDYTGLSSAISGLQATTDGIDTAVTTTIPGTLSSIQGSLSDISGAITGLSATLASDFGSLSSAIASVGSTGPLAGTSEGTTVETVSLDSTSSLSSFSSSPDSWTQIATATSNEVVTGFSVTTTRGSITQGVLCITWTDGTSTGGVYSVPVGDLPSGVTPLGGVVSPRFSIPAGSTVYVQLVSTHKAGADVQLEFAGLPVPGPTIVTTTTTS